METNEKQPTQTREEQREDFKCFIEFMDNDIRLLRNRMEFFKHLTISTAIGCVIVLMAGLYIAVPSALLVASFASYLWFKHLSKKRNMFIVVRESTYLEMIEL